jgi:hypothetical protein
MSSITSRRLTSTSEEFHFVYNGLVNVDLARCFKFYEQAHALQRLLPLMKASDIDLKTTTAMMLANLVKKEEEFEVLKSDQGVLDFMILQLTPAFSGYDTFFSEAEVIMGLQRLSVNDENKVAPWFLFLFSSFLLR